jgi:hypothetical protein
VGNLGGSATEEATGAGHVLNVALETVGTVAMVLASAARSSAA